MIHLLWNNLSAISNCIQNDESPRDRINHLNRSLQAKYQTHVQNEKRLI